MKRKQALENRLAALERRYGAALGPPVVNVMRIDGDPLNPRPIQTYAGLSFELGGPGVSPGDSEKSWFVHREAGEAEEEFYRRAVEAAIKREVRGIPIFMFASERLPGEPAKPTGVHVGLPDGRYLVE